MAMSLSAAPVDQFTAARKAQSFLTNELYAGKIMSPAAVTPVLLKAEMGISKLNQPVYYIYNTATTFIVVAGDDRAVDILMVGDRPLRDVNNLPGGMQDMLGQYKDQIMFLQEHPGLRPTSVEEPSAPMLNATTYGPLLTCNWDQEAPYYNQCKFSNYQCLTGCPATSASMVFYFWKYPTGETGVVPGYKSTISISNYSSKSYTHSALPSTTFDWANMLDSYTGSYTTAQGTAVATLMHYVGQAERMGYGVNGSGVSVDSVCNIRDAFLRFGYDSSTTRFVKKTSAYSGGSTLYSDSQWASMIQEEMAAGRPIVFCAVSSSAGGHAFNVDGYNSSTNKYHINFGWSGEGNAWCALNSFGYSSYNFNVYQQMVIGIQPPSGSSATPTLTVSPTSLSFSATAGETVSKTFTVTGTNLTGNVTLTKTDANGVYTISPSTITASAAASGATVTVTYKPTAAGTHTGSIAIASSGATSKTVSLSGTASAAALTTYTPVMSAANSSYITTSSFRADWTDQTASANVSSYTLQVNGQGSTPSNEVTLLGTINGSNYTGSYTNITLTAPWGGSNVRGGNNAVYTKNSSGTGNITFTVPSGYTNATFSVQITTVSGTYGTGNITVKSASTSALGHTFSKGETYTWIVTASSGDKITIYSTDSSYSPDMSLIKVYAGNINLNASETGDANARTITGITNKYYTVSNLTAGATYTYKVKALYTDGTSSAWSNEQSVTLNEEQQTATPTLTVTPTSLSMSAKVGATKTATFKVTGADLTGNVTLSLSGASVFSISTTSITAANAANGVNVTVTYAPTAYGTQTATVTVASSGATSKTVALTGNATLDKADPVLNAATNISSTGFTANWTHDVDASSVSSYSLYATRTAVPDDDEPTGSTLLGSLDGSNYTGSYASITLTSPWGGSNVKAGNGAIYTKNSTSWWGSSSTRGYITYTIPSGYSNATFTVQITTASTSYGSGNITVMSTKTSAVGHSFSKGETYTWTVTGSAGDVIKLYSTDSSYSPDMTMIAIYAGTLNLNASVSGDQAEFVVTDIDAGTTGITLSNLTEGATYSYYLVANYVDGTTATSNTQEVTLVTVNLGNNTAINAIAADVDEVESVTYVNMSGVQSKQPWDGVNIVVTRYKNGTMKSTKVRY
ncbi:MAG: C10 family peptidase [Muribaculaceae bacterium]|nr:C10 family peptidase [Muribaculaceae bacterium]